MKILTIILFFVLVSEGYGKCLLNDISVTQTRTGVIVKGKPEWSVTVTNKCSCAQTNVILNCSGFQSLESIDPSVLTVSTNTGFCLLTPGQLINKDGIVSFKYTWGNQFSLNPISSQSSC
ncbi:hypothetical protein VNO80_10423 [Phaseolus coccineus]|uniref:Uncharacterized protein n=1 Tax=Phaseolus coccineus TaxID=3886 RepID=A0AAN9NDC6_PHACN